jgi:hypothetical protein
MMKNLERSDPVLRPRSLFDPTDPQTSARVIALTAVAQPRHALTAITPFYGAGVYALYYRGPFAPYKPLSGTEQPVYVGKADPSDRDAGDAVKQGQALFTRLTEHKKSIQQASSTLDAHDFDCRFLIVQSGYQAAAEIQLIDFFRPIWNSQTKICQGLGKHGDSATTRANKRSPWDTMHPGRPWADKSSADQKPMHVIVQEIEAHLVKYPPKGSVAEVFQSLIDDLRQIESFQLGGASFDSGRAAAAGGAPADASSSGDAATLF